MSTKNTTNIDFVKPPSFPGVHVYDGYTFPAPFCAANFDAMKTWQVREDDIFCITYAKSGTHWIFEIVTLIVNGGDPSLIERSHMATTPEISLVSKGSDFNNPEAIEAAEPGYKVIDTWESPRVIPTHMHERFFPPDAWKKAKMIYLGRNYKDLLCSLWTFASKVFPPGQEFDNWVKFNLLSDEVNMGPWFDHVKGYEEHHHDDNFLFLRYEDLQKDLLGEVKRIAKFLDYPLSDEQPEKVAHLCTMDEMRKTYDKHEKEDPNGIMNTRRLGMLKFLNKGKVGNWKDKITGELNEFFDRVYEEKMSDTGVKFDFEI